MYTVEEPNDAVRWKGMTKRMKKGEIYEGIVENMDFPNKGNIYIEGERVIVKTLCRDRRCVSW